MTPRNFKLLIFAAALSYGASRCLVSEPPAKASPEFKERSQAYYAKKAARESTRNATVTAAKTSEPERLPAQAVTSQLSESTHEIQQSAEKNASPAQSTTQLPTLEETSIPSLDQSPAPGLAQSAEAPKNSWSAGDDFLYIRCGNYLLRYQLSADRAAVRLLDRFLKEQDRKILLKSSSEDQTGAKTIEIADELLTREQAQDASIQKPPPWRYNVYKEKEPYFLVTGRSDSSECNEDADVNSLVTTKIPDPSACRVARLEQVFTWWDHGEPECEVGSTGKIYRTTRTEP